MFGCWLVDYWLFGSWVVVFGDRVVGGIWLMAGGLEVKWLWLVVK